MVTAENMKSKWATGMNSPRLVSYSVTGLHCILPPSDLRYTVEEWIKKSSEVLSAFITMGHTGVDDIEWSRMSNYAILLLNTPLREPPPGEFMQVGRVQNKCIIWNEPFQMDGYNGEFVYVKR